MQWVIPLQKLIFNRNNKVQNKLCILKYYLTNENLKYFSLFVQTNEKDTETNFS